jgi:Outer membrane lipoprotein
MRYRGDAHRITRSASKTQSGRVPGRRQCAVAAMRHGRSVLALLLLAAGCSGVPSSVRGPSEAERLVARADALAGTGWEHAARALYERVGREYPRDPATASALYSLGRLQADPTSGFRDYRAAHGTFSRLLADFPKSRWEADARAWRATLSDLLAREEEATHLKVQLQWREAEASRLKVQLQSREEEAFGLRAQLQQLRRVDLELERRR